MQRFVQKVIPVLLIVFFSLSLSAHLSAQVQFNTMYHTTGINNWELDDSYAMNQNQLGFSLGYGFSPLTNVRWEIFPQAKVSFGQLANTNYAYNLNSYGINIHNKLYPLTFMED